MMFKKQFVKIICAIILAGNLYIAPLSAQIFNEDIYKFSRVMGYLDNFYVDTVNTHDLVEVAIEEMLKELDPHSIYISKEEVERMNEPLQGSFDGIGVQFNIFNDTLMVVSPISGGPSEKVGIQAGDRIIRIDDEMVAGIGLTNERVFELLRGERGTKVTLGIKRKYVSELLDFEITRDKIPIYSLDAAYMADEKNKIGYVKLNRFAATTMKEYSDAMKQLKADGAVHLILDLTNNGGGYLNQAFELADEFLEQGQMVVYTEGQNSPREDYVSTRKSAMSYGRVVVMIDGGSASASEIVSGAVQDWDRAVIVGRRSFGKGLVQRPLNLPDGSMMRLTTAKYYTPTGRLIQKPYENGVDDYRKDLINRYNNGELSNEDSIHFPDSLKYLTMQNKRPVYGGGGIMPDIFVPIDTTDYTDYYGDLIRKGIINQFVLTYLDENRDALEGKYLESKKARKSSGFDLYLKNFEITDAMLQELIAYGEEKKVPFVEDEFEISKESLRVNLKANIARDLWDSSEFFEIINGLDPIYLKALEVIQDADLYKSKLQPNE